MAGTESSKTQSCVQSTIFVKQLRPMESRSSLCMYRHYVQHWVVEGCLKLRHLNILLLSYKINMKAKHVQANSYINVPMTHTQLALLYNIIV